MFTWCLQGFAFGKALSVSLALPDTFGKVLSIDFWLVLNFVCLIGLNLLKKQNYLKP